MQFKVGDKVKIVGNQYGNPVKNKLIGTTSYISRITGGAPTLNCLAYYYWAKKDLKKMRN